MLFVKNKNVAKVQCFILRFKETIYYESDTGVSNKKLSFKKKLESYGEDESIKGTLEALFNVTAKAS